MNPTSSMQDRDPFPSCVKHISPYYPRFYFPPQTPLPLVTPGTRSLYYPRETSPWPHIHVLFGNLNKPNYTLLTPNILCLLILGNSLRFSCESVYLVDTLRDSWFYPVCCSIMNLAIIRHNHCVSDCVNHRPCNYWMNFNGNWSQRRALNILV